MTDETFKSKLTKTIKNKKESLSDNSVRTYISNLMSINKKLKGDDTVEWFSKNNNDIIEYIKKSDASKQSLKTYLSALYILTGIQEYKTLMITYCNEVNNNYKTQKMTDKQESTRISFEDVKKIYMNNLLTLKNSPTLENYVNYLACALSSGFFIPPRRAEVAYIKIKNYDKEKDNYIDKNRIVFNNYKTSKKYGQQFIDIPKEIIPILKKYLKVNESDFLFPNKNGDKCLTNSDYTRLLNDIFGKSISVDALRSIYLSHKYKDIPKLTEMQATATAMGHSITTGLTDYVKK